MFGIVDYVAVAPDKDFTPGTNGNETGDNETGNVNGGIVTANTTKTVRVSNESGNGSGRATHPEVQAASIDGLTLKAAGFTDAKEVHPAGISDLKAAGFTAGP